MASRGRGRNDDELRRVTAAAPTIERLLNAADDQAAEPGDREGEAAGAGSGTR